MTTKVSALVAPYLRTGSGYIAPAFRERIAADRSRILAVAARYNDPAITHFSDRHFATIMLVILYNEHNGWLEDMLPGIRVFTPAYQDAQAVSNAVLGTNFSVWPSNLRPSVVREIYDHEVPAVGTVALPIPKETTDAHPSPRDAANDTDTAYELLGANLRRGIIRAQHEGVRVTWQTLLAWHNAGIVAPQDIRGNPALQHYLRRARAYLPTAQHMYERVSVCAIGTTARRRPPLLHAQDDAIALAE